MTEHKENDAPFDARRARVVFVHEGTLAELRPRWQELLARDQKAIMVNMTTVGLMFLAIGMGLLLLVTSPWTFPVQGWIGAGMIGLGLWSYYRCDRINLRDLLDSRKRKLVDALIAKLGKTHEPEDRVALRVDFHSPRREATRAIAAQTQTQARQWTGAPSSTTEPSTHDWLRLSVPDVGAKTELELRMRSLLGTSIGELRLRDELVLELRGPALAEVLEPAALNRSDTTLVAHQLESGHAYLQFRGQRAASREPAAAIQDTDVSSIVFGVVGLLLRGLMPEAMRNWDYRSHDALLTGPAVLEHIELSKTTLGIKSKIS